ncbi:MAG: ATP-binding protein [Oscillospiraceae bacterium]|nr:ATP-binding protein [Oscillospiraceae bacterium]
MRKIIQKRTIAAFLLSLTLFAVIVIITAQSAIAVEETHIERLIHENGNRISEAVSAQLYQTKALAALVIQGDGVVNDFERTAEILAADMPAHANFLLAPGGVVTEVFPLQGNEAVLGLDFFNETDHAGNREAIIARDTGELVMAGPFVLRQGGLGLVGRYPVYIGDEFWGLVSVSLRFPQAIDSVGLSVLAQDGYSYELWRINPDTDEKQVIATGTEGFDGNAPYVERTITIHNAQWYLRISPVRAWYQYFDIWLLIFVGVCVSAFIAFFIQSSIILKERNELENQLAINQKLKETAEYSSAVKSEFLSRMSHEMRTPLNVITGLVQLVQMQPHTSGQYLSEINKASCDLLGLINDVLDFSCMEYGTFKLNNTEFDVVALFNECITAAKTQAAQKSQVLSVNIDSAIPNIVTGDERRLKQVISAILANAVKFTPENGEISFAAAVADKLETRITLGFEIADNGIGVPAEQQGKIFELFEQGDGSLTREHCGIGIGLPLSKRILELMNGKIEIESNHEAGTMFRFSCELLLAKEKAN